MGDSAANNAYFVNIVLLAMLFGTAGASLPKRLVESNGGRVDVDSGGLNVQEGEILQARGVTAAIDEPLDVDRSLFAEPLPSFIDPMPKEAMETRLKEGIVVENISVGKTDAEIWQRLQMARTILRWTDLLGNEGVRESGGRMKGFMSFPNFPLDALTLTHMKVLASIVPGCTVTAFRADSMVCRYRLQLPERICNLPNTHCKNELCVSHPNNRQRDVFADFQREAFYKTSALPHCDSAEFLFICRYCRWPHVYEDIWAKVDWQRQLL